MRALVIATIVDDNGKVVRYKLGRLTNSFSAIKLETIEVTEYQLIYAIKNKQISVANVKVSNNKIVGDGASIDRYAKINCNTSKLSTQSSPLVIIKQLCKDDLAVGYMVCDHNGTVLRIKTSDAIDYTQRNGIANGKLVKTGSSEFISPISGRYERFNIDNREAKDNKSVKEAKEVKENKEASKPRETDTGVTRFPTIKKFIQQRKDSGLYTNIDTEHNRIIGLDGRETIIVIPNGIMYIDRLWSDKDNKPSQVQVLVLPPSFEDFSHSLNIEFLPNLRTIIFSDDIKRIKFTDITRLNRDNFEIEFNIPKNIEKIVGLYTDYKNSVAPKIDMSEYKHLEIISSSFTNCEIEDPNINFGTAKNLNYVCTYLRCKKPLKININRHVKSISGITNLNAEEINFDDAVNLSMLGYGSLKGITGLKRLDLSACVNLMDIGGECISNLPDLEELILPPNLLRISSNAISACPKLKSIKLPNSLETISDKVFSDSGITEIEVNGNLTTVVLDKSDLSIKLCNTKSVKTGLFRGVRLDKVDICDGVEIIGGQAFVAAKINELMLPTSLEIIHNRAFYGYEPIGEDKYLDLSKCMHLETIGELAFESSKFEWIALPDGLKTIEQRAFRNCFKLRWVYIPESVSSIGVRSLQCKYSGVAMSITVYTQKGSVADKYARRNNIRVKYVSDINEVFSIENPTVDVRKLSKLRMLLSTDALNSQLINNKKYFGRELELYNIYLTCTREVQPTNLTLDTGNLVKVPIRNVFMQDELDMLDINTASEIPNITEMVSFINFISNMAPNFNKLLEKKNFDLLRKSKDGMLYSFEYVYTSDKYRIAGMRIHFNNKNFDLTFIIYENDIIYCTAYNIENTLSVRELPGSEDIRKPIEDALVRETTYPYVSHSICDTMPSYIKHALDNTFKNQFVLIAANGIHKAENGNITSVSYVLFLSLVSGRIIKANVHMYDNSLRDGAISVIQILDVKDIHEIPDKWRDDIQKSLFNQAGLDGLIPRMVLGDEYLNHLLLAQTAFDKYQPCYEYEVSKLMLQMSIQSIEEFNIETMEAVLQTSYFSQTHKKLEDIKRRFRLFDSIDFGNGRYRLEVFKPTQGKFKENHKIVGNTPRFIQLIVDVTSPVKSFVTCYTSYYSLGVAAKQVMEIYNPNCKTSDILLDNNEVDVNDYKDIIEYTNRLSVSNSTPHLFIGVHKKTGSVFLIGGFVTPNFTSRLKDTHYYKLLRYKDLHTAIESTYWLRDGRYLNMEGSYESKDIHKDIVEELTFLIMRDKGVIGYDNPLHKVRQLVLQGYPNGYVMEGLGERLFRDCAKQSGKPSDIGS